MICQELLHSEDPSCLMVIKSVLAENLWRSKGQKVKAKAHRAASFPQVSQAAKAFSPLFAFVGAAGSRTASLL